MDIKLPDGRILINGSEQAAIAAGVGSAKLAEVREVAAGAKVRSALRARIHAGAGDTLSLVGTNADGVAMLFVEMAKLARDLAVATTVAEVNTAAAPFAALTASFIAEVEAGTIEMPYLVKADAPAALAEISARAHAASAAFHIAPQEEDVFDE